VLRQFLGSDKKQASHPTDTSALKDGVAALMRSNYELGQVGINVNQIAKALNSLQGSFRTKERDNLQAFVQEAREHIGQASKVAAAMRKLLTPRKETR
jgi:Bacterial mobilisation protein (MobC)